MIIIFIQQVGQKTTESAAFTKVPNYHRKQKNKDCVSNFFFHNNENNNNRKQMNRKKNIKSRQNFDIVRNFHAKTT